MRRWLAPAVIVAIISAGIAYYQIVISRPSPLIQLNDTFLPKIPTQQHERVGIYMENCGSGPAKIISYEVFINNNKVNSADTNRYNKEIDDVITKSLNIDRSILKGTDIVKALFSKDEVMGAGVMYPIFNLYSTTDSKIQPFKKLCSLVQVRVKYERVNGGGRRESLYPHTSK